MDLEYLRDRDFEDLTPLEKIRVGILSIRAMGKTHGLEELSEQLIDQGKSVEKARSIFDRHLTETNTQKPIGRARSNFFDVSVPKLPPQSSEGDWEPLLKQKNRSF